MQNAKKLRKGIHTGSDDDRGIEIVLSNMLHAKILPYSMRFGGLLWPPPNEPEAGATLGASGDSG
jgi:hypothetical protein